VVAPKRPEVFDTRDPDELIARLNRSFGRTLLDLRGRNAKPRWRMRHVIFGDVGIVHGRYESEFNVSFPDLDMFTGSPGPLKGSGTHKVNGTSVTVSKGNGVIVSPGGATLHYGPQFEHISMTVAPAALISKLTAIAGDLRFGPLHFDPRVNGQDHYSMRLERLLKFAATEAELSWPMPAIMRSELQQYMMTSFLLGSSNNYSDLLYSQPLAAAPWQVRLAEQFIEANWDQPITIEALVTATGVSARSIFASFKTARGYSPMDFVKRVRLGQARRKLLKPTAATTVSAVAFECGFGNAGHFAVDYRRQFGERPSETLNRGRGE